MNFKKGDKVKFLYQSDCGTVTRILGEGQVMVLNSDDFEVPALCSELILDPDFQAKGSKKTEPEPAPAKSAPRMSENAKKHPRAAIKQEEGAALYAGFVPAGGPAPEKSDLGLYFINDSDFRICYNCLRPVEGSTQLSCISGILEPGTKEYVETIKRQAVGSLSVFKFQLLMSKDRMDTPMRPEQAELRIHAPKLCQAAYYRENDFFDEDAAVLPVLIGGKMADALREMMEGPLSGKDKTSPCPAQQPRPARRSEKEVVDLHLCEIIEDEAGMSPKDMLDYQMKVFREKLEEYIKDPHVKKVVFIHGKGNGTLKLELRKCLERNYKRCEYQDASFEEYGGGATLVYVK